MQSGALWALDAERVEPEILDFISVRVEVETESQP